MKIESAPAREEVKIEQKAAAKKEAAVASQRETEEAKPAPEEPKARVVA